MKKPNIVVILVDDMGYSDLGCYGGEARTPNLDTLADNGVRFTDFYCTPRCCPSRASLLTGLTPHKAGVGWMSFDWKAHLDPHADGYAGTLNEECMTIAEALAPAGYRSYMSGKWHLTARLDDKSTWPLARGFDRSFCLVSGGTDYYSPTRLTLDNKFYRAPRTTYLTDLIGDYAVRFIDQHYGDGTALGAAPPARRTDPFFLYLAFTAPHFPIQAPATTTERYVELYSRGWDQLRQERYERMKSLGIIQPDWELPPRPATVPSWSSLPEYERVKQARKMATYAAMIEEMDANVGKVIEALSRAGALDDTVIMFLSDNGACAEGPTMGLPTHYGECWAHLSNTPLRLYKHNTTQGGVQTPFILSYPNGGVQSGHGDLSDTTGSLYDVMPTCLELAGAEYPSHRRGQPIHPLDGVSLMPDLQRSAPVTNPGDVSSASQPPMEHPDICIEHEGNQMLRSGSYKIVRQHTDPQWQLYDMDCDRTEMHDQSGTMPEQVTALAHRYYAWESQARVSPWPLASLYTRLHGFLNHGSAFDEAFDRALDAAPPEDVVDGDELGD